MKIEQNNFYNLDCRDGFRFMIDQGLKVSCIVTSPPYWAMRKYNIKETPIFDGDPNCEHIFHINKIKQCKNNKIYDEEWERPSRKAYNKIGNENKCPVCRKDFEGKIGQKFCSIKCLNTLSNEERTNTNQLTQICSKCGAWKGQLGLEPNFNNYIKHLCDIFDLAKDCLRDDGTLWVNIGDTYSTQGGQNRDTDKDYSHYDSIKLNNRMMGIPLIKNSNLPSKCLCMIPQRFAIEMINKGWVLRNVIIWHKPNCMPSSAKDRFTVDFEYIYFFVKNRKYYFEQQFEPASTEFQYPKTSNKGNYQKINNPRRNLVFTQKELDQIKEYQSKYLKSTYQQNIHKNIKINRELSKKSAIKIFPNNQKKQKEFIKHVHNHGLYNFNKKNKRSIWTINTKSHPEEHFAIFPSELVKTPIKAGCPKYICTKCNKIKEKKVRSEGLPRNRKKGKLVHINSQEGRGDISGKKLKDWKEKHPDKLIGWEQCNCNVDFKPGIVLDPFAGIGTTLRTAWDLGRNYIGFEVSEKYYQIGLKNLSKCQNHRLEDFIHQEKDHEILTSHRGI